ncbi:MAG: hypothetical protein ACKPKO_18575, partial [Candidatus Fonsibacter sp.]
MAAVWFWGLSGGMYVTTLILVEDYTRFRLPSARQGSSIAIARTVLCILFHVPLPLQTFRRINASIIYLLACAIYHCTHHVQDRNALGKCQAPHNRDDRRRQALSQHWQCRVDLEMRAENINV